MMNIMALLSNVGTHLTGWRHPDAWSDTAINLDLAVQCAKLAERGKLDMVFLADGNGVRDMNNRDLFTAMSPSSRPGWFEPTTLLSAIATQTDRIGLIATATTTYDEPFLVARRYASLDHISGGRAGWNVVTTSYEGDALNFNRDAHVPKDLRYERAKEFVTVVKGLWDSWGDDAFPQDKASGHYLDPDKVHVLNHKGSHFQVQGPLNVARTPQGRPIIFHAGQSEAGLDLGAAEADCIFAMANTKERARALNENIRARAAGFGRDPRDLRILTSATLYPGRTSEEAEELIATLGALIPPGLGLSNLSKLVVEDLSGYNVDDPMPELPEDIVGVSVSRKIINDIVRREQPTIRQVYERFALTQGGPMFKGSPIEIADQMEEWYAFGACDGFLISPAVMPTGLEIFIDAVIPELQRRGLFRTEYPGTTLRDTLGLSRPANPHFN